MAIRFRKRIKILPGVHISIGKKGVSSVSVGPRGASVNLNTQGAQSSVSVPGTGVGFTSGRVEVGQNGEVAARKSSALRGWVYIILLSLIAITAIRAWLA